MTKRLALLLQVGGLTSVTAAGFLVSNAVGLLVLGVSLLALGVAAERN